MPDDTNKAPRIAFTVTHQRVQHYADVTDHIVQTAIAKCQADGWNPSQSEIEFFTKQVTRLAVIRRDVEGATKLKLQKQTILNE